MDEAVVKLVQLDRNNDQQKRTGSNRVSIDYESAGCYDQRQAGLVLLPRPSKLKPLLPRTQPWPV